MMSPLAITLLAIWFVAAFGAAGGIRPLIAPTLLGWLIIVVAAFLNAPWYVGAGFLVAPVVMAVAMDA